MGILNSTPDSFSDGGRFNTIEASIGQALLMREQGANIIDVGGESTRPGARQVSEAEELDRVIPVIERLTRELDIPVSVDTTKAVVMTEAVKAGAAMINDVCALQLPGAMDAAVSASVPVCLMHMQGDPRTMQAEPHYEDVVVEVRDFLNDRIAQCEIAGLNHDQIIIDPGFGFGKTVAHNLSLLHELEELTGLGFPVLAGLSRKSLIGKLLNLPVDSRAHASVALALIAVQHGARFVRVHDVAETVQAVRMWEAVQSGEVTAL
ncbi:MAG: dihydropteroate synthase [Gammaproteobacteria bacterium]|nr:dihydropteroate synthase [Gammaproteobacteria bacterium]